MTPAVALCGHDHGFHVSPEDVRVAPAMALLRTQV